MPIITLIYLHFHVTKAYAHLASYEDAQHQVGQRYLHGKGVEQHHGEAMRWFKHAAERGHPHASLQFSCRAI
uniref:Sel1 repeat family protein n=1 Tax=Macrostomum lignano TaxID=282301 RepID=A0A1I8FMQ8_9PLAT